MSLTLPVESVSDTAFLLAFLRALESERDDALFIDPQARCLAGPRGAELAKQFPGATASASGCVVRTHLIDELVLESVREKGTDTVLNLGAGLDTRPYRLDLPRPLRWIEVDSAEVLDYKRSMLRHYRPQCSIDLVALDVTDIVARRALLARVAARGASVLVITEGLIVYLEEEEVRTLALDLHDQPNIHWWLTDLASAEALRVFDCILDGTPRLGDVRFKFAPTKRAQFFRSLAWIERKFLSCVEEGRRLKRWILPEPFLAQLSENHRLIVRQLSGVVKMQRA